MMRQIHRRLAWIAGLVAVLWAATGFLHPIMSWTAPRPVVMTPPQVALSLEGVAAPGAMIATQGWREAASVRLVNVDGALCWLAFGRDGETLALNARTGAPSANAESAYARQLALYYTGRAPADIASARRINRFDIFYPSINRILPAWEVRFNDSLTLYLDIRSGRLITMADPLRRGLLLTFQNIHTLHFLSGVEPLRKALIFGLIATTFATALFGIAMAFSAKGRGVRRVHRLIGLIGGPLLLCFSGSGLFHLLASAPSSTFATTTFAVAALQTPRLIGSVQSISATAGADGAALWRAQTQNTGFYFKADGSLSQIDDAARARQIVRANANAPVEILTHYSDEYSFANKRLPVWRVETPGGVRFAELEEGLIAGAAPYGLARAEAWSFDTIHKWQFLNPIGKRTRDILMMLAVSLIATTAIFGFRLKRPSPRPTKETSL